MRGDNQLARAFQDLPDRRQRAVDPMRFGDLSVFDRHIEIDAQENSFAIQSEVSEISDHRFYLWNRAIKMLRRVTLC